MTDRMLHFLLVPLAACCQCLLAAAPATQPFERYTEEIKGTLTKFEMLPIPGGKFVFSPDGKAAPKAIEIKRFWIARTECTWNEFDTFSLQLDLPQNQRRFMTDPAGKTRPSPPYEAPDRGWGHNGFPAICISPKSAKMYCQWLNDKTNRKYRLPTEAEWEYACRAAGPVVQMNNQQLNAVAWFDNNANQTTHQIMGKKPNAWGLHDMLGNAGEWCTPTEGNVPILRGGAYFSKAADVQSTARLPFDPLWQLPNPPPPENWWLAVADFAGFRVVREE
jgi:formylglycine-generating enzyme required for sulfatase activity